jgi:formate dehydrogenase maturation protein FdhE
MRLLEGDQLTVTEVPLRNVPAAITETRVVPVQGRAAARDTAAAPAPLGHFIRMVDQAVWKNHSTISRLPLIVAADVKHLAEFLAAAKNPYVCKQGICHQPDHLSNETLRDEAWKILGPKHDEDVHQLVDQFRTAKAHHHGTDELSEVAEAAAHGRVGTLIVDANRHMPGVLHRDSGMIEQSMQFDPRAEDVLDDLAEMVLQMDGQVYVLPHEQMPTEAGVAAMFRY